MSYTQTNMFTCPITMESIKVPVIGTDGYTYEKEAIIEWLSKNSFSPITRQPMRIEDLKPNRAVADAIEQMKNGNYNLSSHNIEVSELSDVNDLELKAKLINTENGVLCSLELPNSRTPVSIIFVIDVSGSMGLSATRQDSMGNKIEDGYSVLDIVTYAVKTAVMSLTSNDNAAVITFSTNAKRVFPLSSMTDLKKKSLINETDKLHPEATTNIWDGLRLALDEIDTDNNTNTHIILFTDGVSNLKPARGEVYEFNKYIEKNKLPVTLHTLGFGNNLESDTLVGLSEYGSGTFNYIPDSSFVGTIMVNLMANIVNSKIINSTLTFNQDSMVVGSHFTKNKTVYIGPLISGIPKYVYFETSNPKNFKCDFSGFSQNKQINYSTISVRDSEPTEYELQQINEQKFRLEFVDVINSVCKNLTMGENYRDERLRKTIISPLDELIDTMLSYSKTNNYINTLIENINDQIRLAVTSQYYNTWGLHYIRSFSRTHQLQLCNNFKDKSVQFYTNDFIETIKDNFNDIFNSQKPRPASNSYGRRVQVSMTSYNNASNGCFSGNCMIQTPTGYQLVKTIKPGDIVSTYTNSGQESQSRVKLIMKCICENNSAELVTFDNGLVITPWHPIKINHQWIFPQENLDAIKRGYTECEAVYSFVLESDHIVIINDVQCICLGHGFQDNVAYHEYFGSQEVVHDLMNMPGGENGFVTLKSGCLFTNPNTGLIDKIMYNNY